MNAYQLAVDHINNGVEPKDYREMAELWIRINPEKHIHAFQMMVKSAKQAREEDIGWYKPKTRAKAMETPHRIGMKFPASLIRFIETADPDVFTSDKKYQKLKRSFPMLDCEAKFIY